MHIDVIRRSHENDWPSAATGNQRARTSGGALTSVALTAGALFSESIAHLARSTFIPKGVYRFKTHEAANKHQSDCLARGMASLAAERSHGRTDQSSGNPR